MTTPAKIRSSYRFLGQVCHIVDNDGSILSEGADGVLHVKADRRTVLGTFPTLEVALVAINQDADFGVRGVPGVSATAKARR